MSSRQSGLTNVQDRHLGANPTGLPYTQLPPDSLVKYPPRHSERGAPPITSLAHGTHLNHDPEQARWRMPPDFSDSSIQKLTLSKTKSEQVRPADGKTSKLRKLYNYSVVVRWTLFIVPILLVIWIPGVLSLTAFPHASIWSVRLIFWCIWLTIVWSGWWAALAIAFILPGIIKATVGVIAVSTRRYIDRVQAVYRYIALLVWTIAIWVSFNPLITTKEVNPGDKSTEAISLLARLLFALLLCAAALLFEKFSIQWIAWKFHERSYAERIADQKYAVHALATLYKHSINIPRRPDTMHVDDTKGESHIDTNHLFRDIRHGIRSATTITATAFGNVASEIAGSSVLQPNSSRAAVKNALESVNKTRLLSRRLFYSFAEKESEYLFVEDLESFFSTKEEADRAYALFDKDSNGDVSREEMEMACLELHREQISIGHSMQDIDSAVGKLDNILMTLYVIIAILIIAVALETQLITLVTGAGTLILGLSWLIGGSLTETLSSIIFLFIKHPFDVGDRVILNKETYTVKEIGLLSTIFLDSTSSVVQAPNNQLNTLFIQNIRRSPGMSESIVFDVAYSTTFEDLESLREKMLDFVTAERRDYQPVFDVTVKDFPEQSKMTLSADIKYKSNGQQATVKAKRRNKWMCALKTALAEVKIYGPSGDPDAPPKVSRYTQVPWSTVHVDGQHVGEKEADPDEVLGTRTSRQWHLNDEIAAILDSADDVFGDANE